MDRKYSEIPMEEALGIITEEVGSMGDSFGWSGDIPVPLETELGKRGIIHKGDLFSSWSKDPAHTVNPDDIPFLVYKAMDEYRNGREGPLTPEELYEWGSSSFKIGNHKLGDDTIIFNMTSGHDCPARDQCDIKEHCYAVADEKLWGTPLAYRRRQTVFWDSVDPEMFVRSMPIPKFFRFSEAGDFRTQDDVDKMAEIAHILQIKHGIRTYGYTNRMDLNFGKLRETAVVNGHGFMVDNKTVIKDRPDSDDLVCPGDCRTCDLCKIWGGKTIVFPKRKR